MSSSIFCESNFSASVSALPLYLPVLHLYSLNSFIIFSAESLYDFFFSLQLSKVNRPELIEVKAVIAAITHFSQFPNLSHLEQKLKKLLKMARL